MATPGAGKTTFALTLASRLLNNRTVDRVIVVVPTEHLKVQWAESAARMGIDLDPSLTNSGGAISPAYVGAVVTYAQVALLPTKHYQMSTAKRTLVILDEVHHGGDAKSWGDGISVAYRDAERRLCLTGTPFRSDDALIPFVRYVEDGEGHQVSQADHTYGYVDALSDGVVRPVIFMAYSGEARWRDSAGEEFAARLGEPLTLEQTARAWKTALNPQGEWIPAVLRAAHRRLTELRRVIPDAGGLVIASDKTMARAYARILTQLSNTPVTVVLSDEAGASDRIAEFSASTDEWMVAVRMVSEGVDVPRLAVGVYATSAATPLFFAQAIGRFVRSRKKGETASIFLPSVPVLLDLASRLEAQRNHVIGKPDRPNEGWDDDLVVEANQEKNHADSMSGYESLGADAELDSVIYDGSTYGTATIAGSAEEADYLGLPGLLDADQMRELLKRRQAEQLKARERQEQAAARVYGDDHGAAENAQRAHSAGAPSSSYPAGHTGHSAPEPVGTGGGGMRRGSREQLTKLRKELNTLVSITASRTGKPHSQLHSEVRQACGGPQTSLCTVEQLQARIKYLRRW